MRQQSTQMPRGGQKRQSGLALVVVMGTAALAAVLASHVMVMSETTARQAMVAAERGRLRYAAEDAAELAFWLHLADRQLFADRTMGNASTARDESMPEPWMLDGKPHRLGDGTCTVVLHDATRGVDMSGPTPAEELRETIPPDDLERRDLIERFLDVAADYADADDHLHLHGMERPDYEAEGMPALPRNAPLQWREEAHWLRGWREVLGSEVRVIPPAGIAVQGGQARGTTNPPFFSSSPALLKSRAGLTDVELEAVLQARDLWQRDGIPLDQTLASDLRGRLLARFSFVESGVVTIEVDAVVPGSRITRRLSVTRLAEIRRAEAFSDGSRQAWALWRRQWP